MTFKTNESKILFNIGRYIVSSQEPSASSFIQALMSLCLEKGILSSDQIDVALKEQQRQGISFEKTLLSLNFISESALVEALAQASGHDPITLSHALFDESLKTFISREIAERYTLLPLSFEKGDLRVALTDVYNLKALDFLYHHVPGVKRVIPLVASASDILEGIDRYYGYDFSIGGLLREIETMLPPLHSEETHLNAATRLVNSILLDGIKLKASDIHFEPEGAFMRVRYRIDGLLTQICTLHSSYWPSICVRLKVLGDMNIAESRRPQNGRMTYYVGTREIDLRLSSHPTIHGENIVVRILDKDRSLLAFEDLGYSQEVIVSLKKALRRPEGIFIITGPTGCGKTTSLYSLLQYLSTSTLNIMTLEEPVEYKLPLVRQSEIREIGTMDFADGVRSILRQDPDIILVGEIRDAATAHMALRASMTGHQVFSTLHTIDALGSIHRLVDLGLSRGMLGGNLVAIVAQRLLRKLCPSCKEERCLTSLESDFLERESSGVCFVPKGCGDCRQTGYKGRFAIAEILSFDHELSELLVANAPLSQLKKAALRKGYVPLAQQAREKIFTGDTSLEEAARALDLGRN